MQSKMKTQKMRLFITISIVFHLIIIGMCPLIFSPHQVVKESNLSRLNRPGTEMSKPSINQMHKTRSGSGFEVLEYNVEIELIQNYHYLNGSAEIK